MANQSLCEPLSGSKFRSFFAMRGTTANVTDGYKTMKKREPDQIKRDLLLPGDEEEELDRAPHDTEDETMMTKLLHYRQDHDWSLVSQQEFLQEPGDANSLVGSFQKKSVRIGDVVSPVVSCIGDSTCWMFASALRGCCCLWTSTTDGVEEYQRSEFLLVKERDEVPFAQDGLLTEKAYVRSTGFSTTEDGVTPASGHTFVYSPEYMTIASQFVNGASEGEAVDDAARTYKHVKPLKGKDHVDIGDASTQFGVRPDYSDSQDVFVHPDEHVDGDGGEEDDEDDDDVVDLGSPGNPIIVRNLTPSDYTDILSTCPRLT